MKAKTVLLTFATVLLICACGSPSERTAKELAKRIVPEYAKSIKFEETTSETDFYEIAPAGECIVIRGNSANSLAAAPVEVVSSAVIYEDTGDLSDHYPVVVTVR